MTKTELSIIVLPNYVKSVMIGLLLSDAYIVFSAISKNGSLLLTQSLSHLYYIFLFNILSHYCSRYLVFRIRYLGEKTTFSLEIFTRSIPCLTE